MSSSELQEARPGFLSGGCLCEGVRYKVNIPSDVNYPLRSNYCFCTQCRKASGALASVFIHTHPDNIEWLSKRTLKEFTSTPAVRRAFCSDCGGSIYWHRFERSDPDISILAATLDEEYLLNKQQFNALGGLGSACWTSKQVPGVDDAIKVSVMYTEDM